jgi:hypothetical protein
MNGTPLLTIAGVSCPMTFGEWRPLLLPATAGQSLNCSVGTTEGWEFGSTETLWPVALEIRRVRSLSVITASTPGVQWTATAGTLGAVEPSTSGPTAHWSLPHSGTVTASVTGPGWFTWTRSVDNNAQTLTRPDGTIRSLGNQNLGFMNSPLAHSQLYIPAGSHQVQWTHSQTAQPFVVDSPCGCFAIRYAAAGSPEALALDALRTLPGFPADQPLHLISDSGWVPAPQLDPDRPWQIIRSRRAGPASIEFDRSATAPQTTALYSSSFAPASNASHITQTTSGWNILRLGTPMGERGDLIWPNFPKGFGVLGVGVYFSDSYEAWATRNGLPATPLHDADGDGLTNQLESVLGLNPNRPDAGALRWLPPSTPGGPLRFAFPYANPDPTGIWERIEASADLVTWQEVFGPVSGSQRTITLTPPLRYVRAVVVNQ